MKNKLKVCFVLSGFKFGGVERVVSVIANALCKLNLEISILTISTKSKKTAYKLDKRISLDSIYCNDMPFILRTLSRLVKIKKYIKKMNPDIIISFDFGTNISVLLSLLFTKNKIIISERNDPNRIPKEKWKKALRNLIYYRADGIVFQTVLAKKNFNKLLQNKSTVILNPVDINKFHIADYNNKASKIISVGRLEEQKNYPLLIAAFAKIANKYKKVTLDIYGIGSKYLELKKMIQKSDLNDRIFLKGNCDNIEKVLEKADCFVLTSDYEGLPNALMEAMVMGIPCIATDCPCGGPKELIRNDKNGILINVGDERQLIRAIERILNDTDYSMMLSRNSIKIRNRVEEGVIVKKWLDFIGRVIDE